MLLETTRLPFLVGVVITIAVLVVLMTYVVMPAVTFPVYQSRDYSDRTTAVEQQERLSSQKLMIFRLCRAELENYIYSLVC